jgi:hypothetical protein
MMKGVGEAAIFPSKEKAKAHARMCSHIQGRGPAEWTATKQIFERRVGELMDDDATEEDKQRRIAAFRLIDPELVLKLAATPPRKGRRILAVGDGLCC